MKRAKLNELPKPASPDHFPDMDQEVYLLTDYLPEVGRRIRMYKRRVDKPGLKYLGQGEVTEVNPNERVALWYGGRCTSKGNSHDRYWCYADD